MRTHLILAAFALAASPALAQTTAPVDQQPVAQPPVAQQPVGQPAPDAATAPVDATQGAAAGGGVTAMLTTGATVFDTQGGQVGTIEAINGADVVVSTGTAKASIPASSFGKGANGPVLSVTRAQLEAAVNGANTGPSGR